MASRLRAGKARCTVQAGRSRCRIARRMLTLPSPRSTAAAETAAPTAPAAPAPASAPAATPETAGARSATSHWRRPGDQAEDERDGGDERRRQHGGDQDPGDESGDAADYRCSGQPTEDGAQYAADHENQNES